MTKRFFHLAFLIVSISLFGKDREPGHNEEGYISPPSHLLDGVPPEASWIWDSGEINPRNYFLHVRKSFSLDRPAREARAYISAYAFAELYINGQYVDRVPTNPDPEYQTYEEIDLVPYLKEGTNTIAALVYNAGEGLHHRMDARGGFFFQAAITDNKGKVAKVISDRSWRVAKAEAWDTGTIHRQVDHTIGMRERYDARLAYEGWQQSSFDDSHWEQATEIGIPPIAPWNQMVVIRRERLFYEIVKPVSTWDAQGYSVYDFGKEITAFPRFTVIADRAGAEMILGTGERLDADSLPAMKDNVDYTDTYITKEGMQSWQPVTWRAFRYLAIQKHAEISIGEVGAQFRSFPVQRTGSFSCSDTLLNQMWEIGRWTLQICAHDTWMDTPWREQTQYIAGDARYDMRYSAYAFGSNIKLLHDYNILSGAFSQRHSDQGAIRSRYPTGYHLGPTTSTYIPDYQLEWILMLHEHYIYYHDAGLIEQVYPNLKVLIDYFQGYLSADRGLIGKVPGWVVLDHPDTYPMDVSGENTAVNCLYYGALNAAAWMARNIMEDTPQAAEWEKEAQAVKASIQKWLWSEKDKAFKDGFESSRITQQTQVYALKYGLIPVGKKARVVEYSKSQGQSCEQSFSYWLLHTMFSEGEGQWALDYMRNHWGDQMKRDDFNGAWHEMWETWGTTSHSWCSGPTALLPEKVLGVEPLLPGWKQFKIQPCLYDLKWAEGVVPSVAGDISVKLKKLVRGNTETGMQIKAVVPANTTSKIYVPIRPSDHFSISVNGNNIWKNGTFTPDNKIISYDSKTDDYIVFVFKPGSYEINAVDVVAYETQ
ncbi:MAG: family 78 glycoside hydrolase catalytic domain [Bacteroidetes bacterium]|nr:family 78 glycoside hydrolase catalytic domain [Bacteroidota bacterium]